MLLLIDFIWSFLSFNRTSSFKAPNCVVVMNDKTLFQMIFRNILNVLIEEKFVHRWIFLFLFLMSAESLWKADSTIYFLWDFWWDQHLRYWSLIEIVTFLDRAPFFYYVLNLRKVVFSTWRRFFLFLLHMWLWLWPDFSFWFKSSSVLRIFVTVGNYITVSYEIIVIIRKCTNFS